MRNRNNRRRLTRGGTAAAAATLLLASGWPAVATAATTGGSRLPAGNYIVQASTEQLAAAAVQRAGGTVLTPLPIVDGVDASLPGPAARALGHEAAIQISPDVAIASLGAAYGGGSSAAQLTRMDLGSNWSPNAGAGVGVALIDTGVAGVPGIDPSHLVVSPDFSGEGTTNDGYGHGTFMAGLIAGNGVDGPAGVPGVAPGATLVSVKVGDSQGRTTLGQVIQGIGWVVDHQQAYNIRVMSISLGASLPMNPNGNPLDAAVEVAWGAGIAVVAAAGNSGAGSVDSPGDAPDIITVGSETTAGPETMPSWSSYSDSKPDVLAPGVSVESLRDPGSVIDQQNPTARVGGDYFLGTGTSMSTALTAGAAALIVADHPTVTPDQVKQALMSTSGTPLVGHAGPVDVAAADGAAPTMPADIDTAHGRSGSGHGGQGEGSGPPTTDTVRWDTVRWDTIRWDTIRWDTLRWDTLRWETLRWEDEGWG